MKKLFTLLALAASVSFTYAQTSPKPAPKAEAKKECKMGDKCCKESKEKTAPAETKTKEAKKN